MSQCGEMGHIARNCTKSSYGGSYGGGFGGGAGKTCYSCGGYGHMSRKNCHAQRLTEYLD